MGLFNFNKKYLLLIGFLIVIFIYFQALHRQGKDNFLSKISHFTLGEIQTASVILRSEIASFVKKYFFLIHLREENLQLKTEMTKILSQQNLFKEIRQENNRLKQALNFYQNSSFSLLPVQIIAKDFVHHNNLLMINKGSRQGVKKYMGVIHPKGVVGYVFRTTPNSAHIITLLSNLSSLPVTNQRNRINGLVTSYKDKLLSFKHFNLKNMTKTFQKNDIIVTSATEQFPPGFPVGYIQELQHKSHDLKPDIIAKPYVPFFSLEEVFVVLSLSKKTYEN